VREEARGELELERGRRERAAGSEWIDAGLSLLVKLVRELREEPEKEMYDWGLGRTGERGEGEELEEESLRSMKNDLESGEELKGSVSLDS
jgi:hypothetical protein